MVMFDKNVLIMLIAIFCGKSLSTGIGKCQKVPYLSNFNITQFSGRWYEIERSFHFLRFFSSCMSVELTENSRGKLLVDVKLQSRWSSNFKLSEGIASPTRRHKSLLMYKVVTDLPKVLRKYMPGSGIYQIIDTDYSNYAVLWSCHNYGLIHTDFIWVWGRTKEIDANFRAKIYQLLDKLRLDTNRLILPQSCAYI